MIRVEIEPGICGLVSIISASSGENDSVRIKVESDCPKVRKFSQDILSIGIVEVVSTGQENPILNSAAKCGLHSSCPVPVGVLKAAEVAVGIALPKDVSIRFKNLKDETDSNS